MGCVHTLFNPGDEENFIHRPGILHPHKSVTVDAVVFKRRPQTQSELCTANSQSSTNDKKAGN